MTCTHLLKKLLSQHYSREEIARGAFTAGNRTYKGKVITSEALSPKRLLKVLSVVKKTYPKDFNEATAVKQINEKCRRTRLYSEKV